MTMPTHLIMVINRDTCELKLVSAHDETEAEAAFQNLSSLFATTPNDVHKVTIPVATGFCIGEIKSATGKQTMIAVAETLPENFTIQGHQFTTLPPEAKSKNGVTRNDRGEYVQKLADGSEIISVNDFSD
jgi:hypothetical protein